MGAGHAGARSAGGAHGRRGARQTCSRGAAGEQGASGLGARAGQGCALGALSLFLARFDSAFFLSQFLDIVRELGS